MVRHRLIQPGRPTHQPAVRVDLRRSPAGRPRGPRGPQGPHGPHGAHGAHGAHQPAVRVDLAPRAQHQPVLEHQSEYAVLIWYGYQFSIQH